MTRDYIFTGILKVKNKKYLIISLIVTGTTLAAIAIFVGVWTILDNFITSSYVSDGTRELFQETSRVEAMEQPPIYIGTEKCLQCHNSFAQEWLHSSHNTVACEDCHGPGSKHVSSGAPMQLSSSTALCLTCHARLDSKPANFPQVSVNEHSGGLDCVQCHNPMHPNISGPPEMPDIFSKDTDCLICHQEQNLRSMPENHAMLSEETCAQCHDIEVK